MNYLNVAHRVFNTPLMIEESKLQIILGVLSPRLNFEVPMLTDRQAETGELAGRRGVTMQAVPLYGRAVAVPVDEPMMPTDGDNSEGNTEEKADSIMLISVTGTLVNRIAMEPPSSFASYERLTGYLKTAAADPSIKGVLLRVESYGGEVCGAFDCADAVKAANTVKPVWCAIDDNAYSAAFLQASQARRIYLTRTGGAGSVGVIAVHYDFSQFETKQGIKVTAVYAGAKKNWLSQDEPLNKEAAAWLRAEIDRSYQLFCSYVASGRAMNQQAVRDTEAACYTGQDAIDAGFADEIGTFAQALDDFRVELRTARPAPALGGPAANSKKEGQAAMQPSVDQAAGNTPAASQVDIAAVRTEAIKAERNRISAILTCEQAQGRESLARALALESDMDAEAAGRILAMAPKDAAVAPLSPLAAAMARVPNPRVGADAGGAGADDEQTEIRAILVASGNLQGGN
jgi:signal peptide peptidase SppA